MLRDNKWLADRLEQIWQRYFPDIEISNTILVRFGRPAITRLGSIKFGRKKPSASGNPNTYITITGYFRDPVIPEYVVDSVLAHELTHYSHGFYSPHDQLYRHPHKHGVVNKELTNRGLNDILKLQKVWLKQHWRGYLNDERNKLHFLQNK